MLNKAYELIEKADLKEIHSIAYWYRHKQSQAQIVIIHNDDSEKVFSACFPTPVTNHKGIPHILEHSVLCGSKKYPIKDPFVELMKGSMNTFLNAMTFDDMTLYPVASCNDKDFKNLMDIYLDAVFFPNVLHKKEVFMQEGWHYEIDNQQLYYNGVVYNEMKGHMSSPFSQLNHIIKKGLFPNSHYCYISGGNPSDIVQLDYQELLDFYNEHYHPSQCLLYIYGNVDIKERLDYIDKNYLSHFNYQEKKLYFPSSYQKPLEIVSGTYDCEDNYSYFSYNTIITHEHHLLTFFMLQIIDYVLVSSPGALLKQALLKDNIGQDVYSSLTYQTHYPFYSIVCMNAQRDDQERFFRIIKNVFNQVVHEDIEESTIYAALHALKFQYSEQEFGSTPKGLYYNQQILMKWLYNEKNIFSIIEVQDTLKELEDRINNHEFKYMFQELMMNYSSSRACLYSQSNLQEQFDENEQQQLSDIYISLNNQQKKMIHKECEELWKYQDTLESEEVLQCIPILNREDLPRKVQSSINEKLFIEQTQFIYHELLTGHIGYLKLCFDLRYLPLDLLPYASLLNCLFGMIDTKKRSYSQLFDDIYLVTGGIHHSTFVYDGLLGHGEVIPCYEIQTKMFDSEINQALSYIQEMIFESCFDNEQRIMEILIQERASLQSEFMDQAHVIALNETKRNQSLTQYYLYQMDYLGYYHMICDLIDNYNHHDFMKKINQTINCIFNIHHLILSYTGERAYLENVQKALIPFLHLFNKDNTSIIKPQLTHQSVNKEYYFASQVQYIAMSCSLKGIEVNQLAALYLLKHILKCDYLWHHIRVKGGAYGCFVDLEDKDILSFVSYRDPHLQETIHTFNNIDKYVQSLDFDERTLLQYIIGTISENERPLSHRQKGELSFRRWMSGIDDCMLDEIREKLISISLEDLQKLYPFIHKCLQNKVCCVIGNEKVLKDNQEMFNVIKELI